ncbi:Bgh-specific protein [Blumeria hordei DH14]|uniref:Bgh-specific protein n=1 Tax=Blumeria graminis f. sp. hordei (strain DH14) TaxID=546991 RepID=N1JDH1_BLUG1|nr:Bgh-specific protein [Blumeria hordei DH14]
MSCLFAILLYTGLDSPVKDRLVLTYEANGENYYGSFNVNRSQMFPQPPKSAHILKTPTRVEGPGTYITAYCTFKAEPYHMYSYMEKLASGSIPGYYTPSIDPSSAQECLSYLNSQHQSMKGSLEDVAINRKDDRDFWCSEKNIIGLALDGHIRLSGTIDLKTTLTSTHYPLVRLSPRLQMNKFTTYGEFIKVARMHGETYALAWLDDHLRLFKYQPRGDVWVITGINSNEMSTGTAMVGFIRHAYTQIDRLMTDMDDLAKDYSRLLSETNGNDEPYYSRSIARLNKKSRGNMVVIERPVAITATGYLGGVITA